MNTETWFLLGFIWFLGLTLGWCFKKGLLCGIICGVFLSPVLSLLMQADIWVATLAFIGGVLIHTWKPIYNKVQML